MSPAATYPRLNIYLNDLDVRESIKIAAARRKVTLSTYCLEAIRRRLAEEGFLATSEASPEAAAEALDRLRRQIGPIGIPVRDLVAEGRQR